MYCANATSLPKCKISIWQKNDKPIDGSINKNVHTAASTIL